MINYYVYADGENIDSILFDFNSIKVATNNFSSINKLGEGGFGPVYKVLLFIGHTYMDVHPLVMILNIFGFYLSQC